MNRFPLRFGLVKSGLDAHTLGISSLSQLLEECQIPVFIASASVCESVDKITHAAYFEKFKSWIKKNNITYLGFSYRLDPKQALEVFGKLVAQIEKKEVLSKNTEGQIKNIYFAGLPEACKLVDKEFQGKYKTFKGDETPIETLRNLSVPEEWIPRSIRESSVYDELRMTFGEKMIAGEKHLSIRPSPLFKYSSYGTSKDHLIKRLAYARKIRALPLTRAHVGPYMKDREKALVLFSQWLKKLAQSRFLDIVSVGSSQLSQSHFGEDWKDLPNGGGVPFNNELELRVIHEDASPMLVRAYSATNRVVEVARILEKNLNMAWHALSFWWFNQIDGRGPLSVKQGLAAHLETLKHIARWGKPFEPNIPHHFAFRGADDITYIASAYLAAKTAKLSGIRYLVLQNMLNTPKSVWGIKDLVKARALLKLVRELEDPNFRVIYQPRAGLDYFSPDLEKAKAQLAAVTGLMTDVEPDSTEIPEIIHIVSYSEASFLASPEVINESIQITKSALKLYPRFRKQHSINEIITDKSIREMSEELSEETRILITDMEENVKTLYSTEGLYNAFQRGYLPVPYLWERREEFKNAVNWTTKIINGSVCVVNSYGKKMAIQERLERVKHLNS